MKKYWNRFCSLALALLLISGVSMQVFATNSPIENQYAENNSVSPRGIWGADKIIEAWSSGSMTIYVPKDIPYAGLTLRTEALEEGATGGVDFKVTGPNGEEYVNYAPLGVNDEDHTLVLSNATPGYYKISYHAIGDTGKVHIYAWIYG